MLWLTAHVLPLTAHFSMLIAHVLASLDMSPNEYFLGLKFCSQHIVLLNFGVVGLAL